jgi:hypothetical protein
MIMRKLLILASVTLLAAGGVVVATRTSSSQSAPASLTVGIYAPTVEFGTAQQRLQYVQALAKAIESKTGVKTKADSYASLSQLKKANVDFAIIDGQCYATNGGWKLLADANIDGGTTRTWALYSSVGKDMQGLRGKKLAYVQTGCSDDNFIDNAMLESEVDSAFFSKRVGKSDLTAAVAEVASYKGAQAVFAPSSASKGLTKVFDTTSVPNPAFVQVNTKLAASVVKQVESAVTGYGGGGAIDSWSSGSKGIYSSLDGKMGKSVKKGVLAAPEPVRFDAKDVLEEPKTLGVEDAAKTSVDQHFEKPAERME